ncbi:ABC transporter permease subunit [Aeromicrobium marinum]|uniref:ABC transporter permease subunit n=1 Tax=Aeromicrobium marinum TaxID=219314 RepID=UPI00058EFEE6|nr:ABC transporter permease subunit [Aeromicrobium marinum]
MRSLRGPGLLVVPAALLVVVLVGLPVVRLVWSAAGPGGSAGVDEFVTVLGSGVWWTAVGVGAAVAVAVALVQLTLALAFAGALRHVESVWPVARILLLLPLGFFGVVTAFASGAAVDGGFVATWFELDDPGPTTRLAAVAAGEAWRTLGVVTVIVYLGLARVPRRVMDQAVVDGMTPWQRWRRVVLPIAAPALALAAVYRVLDSWRLVDGPILADRTGDVTRTAPLVVWDTAFGSYDTALAAAAAIVLLVLSLVLATAAAFALRGVARR